jgi:hypothetical protein
MPAINFKREFVEPIKAGTKVHTIRARREDGHDPKAGDPVRCYTGMRTKQCEFIRDVEVRRVRPVQLIVRPGALVWVAIDAEDLPAALYETFARNDGFPSAGYMASWFCDQRRASYAPPVGPNGLEIEGLLIQWAPTDY